MYWSRIVCLLVAVALATCKDAKIPGLVFSDFDQLYTKELPSEQMKELDLKDLQTLNNPANKTNFIERYINAIDHNTIVDIQSRTATILKLDNEAKTNIQKISTAFRQSGCASEVKTNFQTTLEKKVKDGDTNCKATLEHKLKYFDREFELIVESCVELKPLKTKQKFMRTYADLYIDLEKTYACTREKNVHDCASKISEGLAQKRNEIKSIEESLLQEIEDCKRHAPKCCSFLKHFGSNVDKDLFC